MKAFFKAILGCDPTSKSFNEDGGILGHVKAYYGCVEAQGRGTLHCHMMVWIDGALNPNEIRDRILRDGDLEFRDRLISVLDDTVCNSIPDWDIGSDPPGSTTPNPLCIRGPDPVSVDYEIKRRRDQHFLAKRCQIHRHTKTCYKGYRGPPEPKKCRFDMGPSRASSKSTFDMEKGELHLRCLDGMVNNFNDTILECVRCNMDIKFIGSGPFAKAVMFYITNYITKSQLKTHVAYAALELAVKKLNGELDESLEQCHPAIRAKKLLQKCAYAMISHQELSAQQVASYVMDLEDHFTNCSFRNVNWSAFEWLVNSQDPSPECYAKANSYKPVPEENSETGDSESEVDVHSSAGDESDDEDGADEAGVPGCETLVPPTELVIDSTPEGLIVPRPGQTLDYVLRGPRLANLCVWDFIAQVEKSSVSSLGTTEAGREPDCVESITDEQTGNKLHPIDIESSLKSIAIKKRERVDFLDSHPQAETHVLRILPKSSRLVPVPVAGQSLPRRDQKTVFERYCRLMLVLFKPWRQASDLRQQGQSWSSAFLQFKQLIPARFLTIMDNMQIIHECKDSRDDHYAARRSRDLGAIPPANIISRTNSSGANEDLFGESTDSDVLSHIQDIESSRSQNVSGTVDRAEAAVSSAVESGLFHVSDIDIEPASNGDVESMDADVVDLASVSDHLEHMWQKAYDDRRDQMLKRQQQTTNIPLATPSMSSDPPAATIRVSLNSEQNNASLTRGVAVRMQTTLPASASESESVALDSVIAKYTLNAEQARAFRLVCEHSLDRTRPPLRMYLGGPGGTGKSQVIKAIQYFFKARGDDRRFRLGAYTGVAASNIDGMTLHTALSLNQRKKAKSGSKTRRDLIAMWEGVDYLFIDEVSMIGCRFLFDISQALSEAKGNDAPFGGVSIIAAGDFAQLPPVGDTRLYTKIKTNGSNAKHGIGGQAAATPLGQKDVLGKLLWLSFRTVVLLKEPMRQMGPENAAFADLLMRLRECRCTDADYRLLSSRVIKNSGVDVRTPAWRHAPIIVSENATKDALNVEAVKAFANSTGRPLHWYLASDTHKGDPIASPELRTKLLSLNSGLTNQQLGRLPLVIGMPVIITQNYDVEKGAVNGSKGTLRKIRYRVDENGDRHAISCVVQVDEYSGDPLPSLEEKQVACLESTVDIDFTHPHTKKRCRIRRTQLPLTPGFAMTAHKAQGQSLHNAIVDLAGCRNAESAYVMVSRVRSLQGLLILRPFDKHRVCSRLSQDLRIELTRLDLLRLHTIVDTSADEHEIRQTAALLGDISVIVPNLAEEETVLPHVRLRHAQTHVENSVLTYLRSVRDSHVRSRPPLPSRTRPRDASPDSSNKRPRPS